MKCKEKHLVTRERLLTNMQNIGVTSTDTKDRYTDPCPYALLSYTLLHMKKKLH